MKYNLLGHKGFLGKALAPLCEFSYNAPVWINAMAQVRGIEGNIKAQGWMMSENLKSAIMVFEEAAKKGVRRVVNFGSTCAYSPDVLIPFQACSYMVGEPEPTNYGYAMAKRAIYALSKAYGQQYAMDNLYLVMPNLYGPGCHFGTNNHVVPDMIVKIQAAIEENATEIVFRGTGVAEREFLYIHDAVKLIFQAVEEKHTDQPLNLTSGTIITIKALAETLCGIMGFAGAIHWDSSFPDGQLKRELFSDMRPESPMPLQEGLAKTVEYYRATRPVEAKK